MVNLRFRFHLHREFKLLTLVKKTNYFINDIVVLLEVNW
jgi:hypothetical protein